MRIRKTFPGICSFCSKQYFSQHPKLYCSQKCMKDKHLNARYTLWINNEFTEKTTNKSLKRLVEKRDTYKCSSCNLTEWLNKPISLELEHKNGNSEDNSSNNLCLICPNCHSQSPTYKARNKGNGRHYRRERYKQGKSY